MPDNTAGADSTVLRDTQKGYIEYLAGHSPLSGTYLEIGPDIGLATSAACEMGHLERTLLIEPNRAVHEQLLASSDNVPAQIFESIDDLSSADAADNAVLIHVLDHLIDPLGYLRDLRARMVSGGMLLAVVHNEASMLRHVLRAHWPPFCLQHPNLFSTRTLTRLVTDAGFEVIDTSPTKNVFPMRHMAKTGASLLGISGTWTDHVPETKVRVRLGNIMMVARA